MPMISYAQNGEDVLLRRVFGDKREGFYIDVGANDPVTASITKHFYDLGWSGVNVEAAPMLAARLRHARPRDLTLNLGISNRKGTATFYEFPMEFCGLSTFAEEEAERHRVAGYPFVEKTIEITTLEELCDEYAKGPIDFLNVDVEGHEREVLEGGAFTRHRPVVVVVEATRPLSTEQTHDRWEPILLEADYRFATFDGLNRYYVRAENAELVERLAAPKNLFDDYVPYAHQRQVDHLQSELKRYRSEESDPVRATKKAVRVALDLRDRARAMVEKRPIFHKAARPQPERSAVAIAADVLGAGAVTILDVGARWGSEDAWYRMRPLAKLVGFEPDEAESERLNLVSGDTERYLSIALSDKNGDARLYVTTDPACSSLFPPDGAIAERYPLLGEVIGVTGMATVPVRRLEDVARENDLGDVVFMKLDVQGAELNVLEGAGEVIDGCLGVEVEVEFMPIYRGQPLFGDVDRFLRQRGFVLWRLNNLVYYAEQHEKELRRTDVTVFNGAVVGSRAGGGRLSWGHALYLKDYREIPLESPRFRRDLLVLAALLDSAGERDGLRGCLSWLLERAGDGLRAPHRELVATKLERLERR
jgi:FkbM family methyltransferase